MKTYRVGFITIILSLFILPVWSQTICERMQQLEEDLNKKLEEKLTDSKHPQDSDIDYCINFLANTDKTLEKLAAGSNDKDVLKEYQFCILVGHSRLARKLVITEKLEKVYQILNPIRDMVFALDNEILGNHATFLCMKQDGSGNRLDNAGYQIVANNYYYCYMSCCCFLSKPDEADKLFDHFAPYRLQNVLDGIYATVAIYVRFKWSSSVADEHRVWASAYLLKKFKDDGVKDSLTMPINMLLQSLNDPALVDTTVPDRANELYLIYRDIDFFRLGNKDNLFITEKAESDMFAQVMRCMTYHTNIPGLLESMQYLGHSVVDRIIGMNDPDLLNKIIFMCEQYKKGSGKRVKEPYFWQNMAKFYMKAGNTDAANKAIEKAKKDKY